MHTSLSVVRHGRTAYNADNRYLGALDPPLDEVGLAQAQALAQTLGERPDVLLCSPLLRARQTAEVLAKAWEMDAGTVSHFAERNVGVYEGLTQDEARTAFPVLWEADITRRWEVSPPGGESIEIVFARVALGLNLVRAAYPGCHVVLVAHGFVAKVIHALVNSVGWDAFFAYALHNGACARHVLAHDTEIVAVRPGR
jgi:probable phosphoglycerate mutase